MTWFLKPPHGGSYGLGICSRCAGKFWIDELYDDPNSPGLKVCRDDMDQLDPYRLPPREPDPLTLEFYRPDVPVDNPSPVKPGDPSWPLTANGTDPLNGL